MFVWKKPKGIAMRSRRVVHGISKQLAKRRRCCPSDRYFSSKDRTNDSEQSSIKIHSALGLGCIDYSQSWAWQHVLLSRRLELRRQLQQQEEQQQTSRSSSSSDVYDDSDCVLLLEHSPVYTLGRGSDENHLTFLQNNNKDMDSTQADDIRQKLSRKARGPQSARLAIDRQVDNHALAQLPIDQAIHRLCQMTATPVMTPKTNVPIYRVERGGEVTFHGPSQLVVYPLLDLRRQPYQKDLHWYLRMVEEVVIQTLQHYNIEGVRDEENTGTNDIPLVIANCDWFDAETPLLCFLSLLVGVWVADNKIAAVGISSSRWITTHGFALNVNPDLSYFDTSVILPCGIDGKGVTSIAKVFNERSGDESACTVPSIEEVAQVVVETMESVFGVAMVEGEPLQ